MTTKEEIEMKKKIMQELDKEIKEKYVPREEFEKLKQNRNIKVKYPEKVECPDCGADVPLKLGVKKEKEK